MTKKPFQYGSAFGQAFAPISGAAGIAKDYGKSYITGFASQKGKARAGGKTTSETDSTKAVKVAGEPPEGYTGGGGI